VRGVCGVSIYQELIDRINEFQMEGGPPRAIFLPSNEYEELLFEEFAEVVELLNLRDVPFKICGVQIRRAG